MWLHIGKKWETNGQKRVEETSTIALSELSIPTSHGVNAELIHILAPITEQDQCSITQDPPAINTTFIPHEYTGNCIIS